MTSRATRRVDLEHTLFTPTGRAPDTRPKRWFFDLPAVRDTEPQWSELLHRIFYDANVGLRRREPADQGWLGWVSFKVSAVDEAAMLAWDGVATKEAADRYLPWIAAASAVVWEPAAAFYVDDAGRYDGLSGYDYSELLLSRALAGGRVDEAGALAFVRKLFPGGGDDGARQLIAERQQRLVNIEVVRPTAAFRRAPGTEPARSGPVLLSDL